MLMLPRGLGCPCGQSYLHFYGKRKPRAAPIIRSYPGRSFGLVLDSQMGNPSRSQLIFVSIDRSLTSAHQLEPFGPTVALILICKE